jgi:hypothetical protein
VGFHDDRPGCLKLLGHRPTATAFLGGAPGLLLRVWRAEKTQSGGENLPGSKAEACPKYGENQWRNPEADFD